MEKAKKSSRGCLWAAVVVAVVAIVAGLAVLVAVGLVAERLHIQEDVSMGYDEYPRMREVWAYGAGDTTVVRIPLRGLILLGDDHGLFGPAPYSADTALRSIRRATHDPAVRALILDVDSGGGGITASDILYRELIKFKEAYPGRQVVALLGDLAASGAYYVAAAADRIVAHPTTITGSIGVLLQTLNFQELAESIGIRDVTIKSGADKDILNPLDELTEEQRAMLQQIINHLHDRFVAVIVAGRGLPEAEVRGLADGRLLTAEDAVAQGLIDQIGYWDDALAVTRELLGADELKVLRYEETFSIGSFFRAAGNWKPASLFGSGKRARFLYRWDL